MILKDIYNYLRSCEALCAVLGAGETDGKIYPNYAAITSRVPHIVYRSTNTGASYDEVLCEEGVSFIVTSDDFLQTVQISKALSAALDLTCNEIPSSEYKIYYGKKIGGSDFIDELGRPCRALNFIFKFK